MLCKSSSLLGMNSVNNVEHSWVMVLNCTSKANDDLIASALDYATKEAKHHTIHL